MKKSEIKQLIKEEIAKTSNKYPGERLNPREEEIAPGVINHNFDTIDIINLDNGYKIKIISTYSFRDPGTKGYSKEHFSEENPVVGDVKSTLITPSGKPIGNKNFAGSNQHMLMNLGKEFKIKYITAWWENKMNKLGLS